MNTKNPARPTSPPSSPAPVPGSKRTINPALVRGLGLAAWIAVVLAATTAFEARMPQLMAAFDRWTATPGMPAGWYVSSGQWLADTRTAAAILRYVLSPEPAEPTGPILGDLVPPPPLLAVTNGGTHLPSA